MMVLELAPTAVGLVYYHTRLHRLDATHRRVRTLRPQSRKGAARDMNPADMWRQIGALESHLHCAPGAWIAWTLTGQPEKGATLGAVIGAHSGDTRASTQAVERVLAGIDADLLVDIPPDPLAGAMRPGAVVLWEALALVHRRLCRCTHCKLSALAAALRRPLSVTCADIQFVVLQCSRDAATHSQSTVLLRSDAPIQNRLCGDVVGSKVGQYEATKARPEDQAG
jgi:hypothetical protein